MAGIILGKLGEKNDACAQYVPNKIPKRAKMSETIPKSDEGAALRSSKLSVTILKDSKPFQNAALWSHNPKVGGSNPPPATNYRIKRRKLLRRFFHSGKSQRTCAKWRSRGAELF